MSFSQINQLRKTGRLREAWQLAHSCLTTDSDNIWNRRAMAWVLYDYAKLNATFDRHQQFLHCLNQINTLQIPPEENLFWEQTAWLVRGFIATCQRNKSHTHLHFSQLFESIRPMPFPKPSESWSALLQTTLRLKTEWPSFPDFCQWWGLDNLRPEDYQPVITPDGHRILSLAERVYMAYTKAILTQNRQNDIVQWEPTLAELINLHPAYIYLPYYLAKIRISLGKPQLVHHTMRTFARKKRDQFWVWELLGDIANTPEERFCLYSKAITCPAKDEMLVSLREKMVSCLIQRQNYPQARFELDRLLATRQRNQWTLSPSLMQMQQADWYLATQPDASTDSFYTPYAKQAESLFLPVNKTESRTFSGKLTKTRTGIGFVGEAYLPAHLAEKYNHGSLITVSAIRAFDKKKNRWGWKVIRIIS